MSIVIGVNIGGTFTDLVLHDSATPVSAALEGPAIIEQGDTTTVVPPGIGVRVDVHGNLMLSVGNA